MARGNTREKILDVAEKLFSEKGFHGAGIREITSKAGVNLSAVNYHFKSKEMLYLSVFKERFAKRVKRIEEEFERKLKNYPPSPESVIRALAEAIIQGPMSDRERSIHYRLLVRETTEPSGTLRVVLKKAIGPFISNVAEKLKPYFPETPERKLLLSVLSIFAQAIYFNFLRTKVTALTGEKYTSSFKKEIVDHIVSFSLKGLEGMDEA